MFIINKAATKPSSQPAIHIPAVLDPARAQRSGTASRTHGRCCPLLEETLLGPCQHRHRFENPLNRKCILSAFLETDTFLYSLCSS